MPDATHTGLAADVARERQTAQLAQIDGLDTKAATLLGFVGVVLALLLGRSDLGTRWQLLVAALLLAIAVLALGYALWPRSFRVNPNLRSIAGWVVRGDPDPNILVTASIQRALDFNAGRITQKIRGLQAACGLVAIAVIILAVDVASHRASSPKAPNPMVTRSSHKTSLNHYTRKGEELRVGRRHTDKP